MSQSGTKIRNQQGQGVVELILVMLVSVSVILGVVYQLNDAFGSWAKNYFGEYVSCLLETGELPALGGQGQGLAGQCNEKFEPFSIESGRPLIGAGVGEGGGESNASNTAGTSPVSKRRARPKAAGGGGGGNLFGDRASFRSNSRFTPSSSGGGNDKTYTGATDGDISGLLGGRNRKITAKNVRFRRLSYNAFVEDKKKKVSGEEFRQRSKMMDEGEVKQRAVKMLINRRTSSKKQAEPDASLSFGDYLKYIIIIAIIIAIVLFFGNQAMQISKSME